MLSSYIDAPKIAGFWPSSTLRGSAQAISLLGYFQRSTETPHLLHQGTIFHCKPYSSTFPVIWTKDGQLPKMLVWLEISEEHFRLTYA